jgi:Fic family protein
VIQYGKLSSRQLSFYDNNGTNLSDETFLKLAQCEAASKILKALKMAAKEEFTDIINHHMKVFMTYHSSALDGSTLTIEETDEAIVDGWTAEAASTDGNRLDAQGHWHAADYLLDVVDLTSPATEQLVCAVNALMLGSGRMTTVTDAAGQKSLEPLQSGMYKARSNIMILVDGTAQECVAPEQVSAQMDVLFAYINSSAAAVHPVVKASVAHYNFMRIHPFQAGNGRGARLLANWVLRRNQLCLSVIPAEGQQDYLRALQEADQGNIEPLVLLHCRSLMRTSEVVRLMYERMWPGYPEFRKRFLSK